MALSLKKYWRTLVTILIILVAFGFFWLWATNQPVKEKNQLTYGLTFSPLNLKEMNLDWHAAYTEMLDDLKVKKLRLVAYWPTVEAEKDKFTFTDIDWQIEEAQKRDAKVILAVGSRLPRWPECHYPEWTKNQEKTKTNQELLSYLEQTIKRYDSNPTIEAWQIENEPFLFGFGECPKLDKKFLDEEIALAKKLSKKPIIITDSGELSLWVPAAKRADIFGTSIYRHTYSQLLNRYITYPLTPNFFKAKTKITKLLTKIDKIIVIELQAEPWGREAYYKLSPQERNQTMNMAKFKENIEFSRQGGFDTFYLWGIEWWYWEKITNHNDSYWQYAKEIFAQSL
ncbi:MAG TPA: cellulase family glycosylhydrolase [bacterium]|nr:cellulase family glycosylhydrolase [bacterium]